ncbi:MULTISPECIES: lipopolysaccharide assembly protein LapB [Pseudoalteromonas]|uniref:Lipopolysaccharide assembly protein LapB n=1 Tax=Pseudoalteromonas amylolytica TaxID=1859457 RepID=A0A1S1MW99_9GAMM|nr:MULTISPECIES: lipopolysaccharide assembly protein LapB [Pseudoalteromonas]MCF6434028.1 lipopolysaccharide assembly protein LapB [Pseudoalteromonas sp. MMG022]OHU88061.1 lipopolysaccharide assembly protein LapB [Pseudoalteromonas sp. JW3]OHU91501.1 lipopolysaccharide assembly protein LapB [Pseudoalteromonas amylolytica]
MTELLFLLLPVAAAYGYVMGKNSAKNQALELNRQITSQYSKGLKFLLDREEDQGLEHLIQLLEVSADSVEHYLTLATLFRKRGELDRAIKIHELLLNQPSLSSSNMASCRLELAQDYVLAGLLDSAEEHLVILVKDSYVEALDPIINLYSQMREWHKGISMFEAHSELFTKAQHCAAVANFYCEAALVDNTPKLMEKACALDHMTIRPYYELGKEAFEKQDHVKAIYYWRKLVVSKTNTAPLYIKELEQSYIQLNLKDQFDELIEELLCKGGVLIRIKHCQALLEKGNHQQAVEFLTDSLKREPTIRGFSFLLQLLGNNNAKIKSALIEIDKLVTSYIATKPEYQCKQCGFSSHKLYWLCPSCKHWETIGPSKGLDGY